MNFQELLQKDFYGNDLSQWGIALLILIGAAVAGKVLYWFTSTVVRRWTARTKTSLDDILIDMIDEPIVLAATLAGTWVGLKRLTFPENVDYWIDRVAQGLIVLAVTWMIARLLDAMYREYLVPLAEKSDTDLDDQVLPILRRSTKMAVWALGVVVALNNAGYEIGALLAGLGIGGLALAMAAKDTVSNVFGGFTIFTDRPFTVNDRIRVEGFDGVVEEVGLRSTRLRTLDGTLVTIPNSSFGDSAVENVSAEPSRKVTLQLGLTYDTTPEQMEEAITLLREIAAAHQSIEEEVKVGFNGFGDFSMNLLFIYYIRSGEDILQTQTDVNLAILTTFNGKGLDFAFPTQTILTKAA